MNEFIGGILKKYWGYDSFRETQEDIINAVLDGKDTLALLPTGGGKSICFQIPAMMKDGLCLVISPLIALMKDQVENLKKKNINALSIYSGMSFSEVKRTLENAVHGNFKFLYVSPERLETEVFLEYLPLIPVNLIAVDEAHCVSQWGYDFRPPYLRIANLREYLPEIPILALTASATKEVQDDIFDKLAFKSDSQKFLKSFERPNLSYSVFNVPAKQTKLLEICKNVSGTGIIYCRSRKRTKEIADFLKFNNIKSDYYHAGLGNDLRTLKQESWKKNEIRMIVCTNAFGMGIDKSDVRTVIHYDAPDALESYYQEAGRAGRDGKKAYAVLLYHESELEDLKMQPDIRYPSLQNIKTVYRALVNYLQLPAGSGEGVYFDFDINDFVKKFNLNIYTANYSLKVLEQEDIISYNEQIFLPSTLVFCIDKNDLIQFEIHHPELEDVAKGLLRSYEGIFDYPTSISEKELADFTKKEIEVIKTDLNKLHKFGIVNYQPQKDKPQILFLKNRPDMQDFRMNYANHEKRKHAFEIRVQAMINFIKRTTTCRSRLIGNYFNDFNIKPCGVCDNCINEKNLFISKEDFENITKNILNIINDSPVMFKELISRLKAFNKSKIFKVINFLISENKIKTDGENVMKK